jgi:hypothetical protein
LYFFRWILCFTTLIQISTSWPGTYCVTALDSSCGIAALISYVASRVGGATLFMPAMRRRRRRRRRRGRRRREEEQQQE